ncbi:MAG: ABC transporter permease [Spirochaetia bacterium]|jgi:ABC-type antimicrobial peptide transport system permease subunit|nr:ABC transporter permease [Spirochaetia bacterium]
MKAYIVSQFLHRPGRAIGVIGGVALGAALFVALTSLGTGFRQAAQAPLAGVAADLLITRPSREGSSTAQRTRGIRLPFGSAPFSPDEVNTIKAAEGINKIATALEVWDFGANQYQVVLGVNPDEKQLGPGRVLQEGLVSGRVFNMNESGVSVVDRHYAAIYSLKPGDTVTIGERDFQVVGIVDQQSGSQAGVANLYIPLSEARGLVGMDVGHVNQIYARITDASKIEAIVTDLTAQLGTISAMSQESIFQVMGGVARISSKFSFVASLVGMTGGMALAWVALTSLITERRREIGVMKAIGWRSRDVIRVLLSEILILGLFGGLGGISLGSGLAALIGYLFAPIISINETLPGLAAAALPSEAIRLSATVTTGTLGLALLIAVSTALLAGWNSVWQAARLKPMQTLHEV